MISKTFKFLLYGSRVNDQEINSAILKYGYKGKQLGRIIITGPYFYRKTAKYGFSQTFEHQRQVSGSFQESTPSST